MAMHQADPAMKEKSIQLRQRLLGNPERKILYSCGCGQGKSLFSGRRAGMKLVKSQGSGEGNGSGKPRAN